MRCVIIVFLWTFAITAQIKDDISVVQYTAGFASEISLKSFKDYNTQTLYIEKNGDIFKKEKIKFLPTLVLYNDGKEILKIESGISMKLPENCLEQITKQINKILETRF
jgi:hypothetical protein